MEAAEEEQSRLRSEAIRSRAQLLGSERILLPTRGGANSVYAAHQLKALFPDAEVTVLTVAAQPAGWRKRLLGSPVEEDAGPGEVIRALGSDRHRLIRKQRADPVETILNEAALGYDLVVLGATEATDASQVFSSVIDRVLARLELPTLIFRYPGPGAPGVLPADPDSLTVRRVLLSVESNRASRAAEEVAYYLAAHGEGSVLALHLIAESGEAAAYLDPEGGSQDHRAGLELVEESVAFGERLGAQVNADVRPATRRAAELVETANAGNWDLLVMGATNRPLSQRPFFGYDMSYVIKHVTVPMVMVAIPDLVSRYASPD